MRFYKYQGAGNDFVILDNRQQQINRTDGDLVARWCDRRFGIGADGLILLQNHPDYDFEMVYFNADGRESSMCGNGGRCIVAFAHRLGLIKQEAHFLAIDGAHRAVLRSDGLVELQMGDVPAVQRGEGFYTLDTGSPHFVRFMDEVERADIVQEGRKIRYSPPYREAGINVNLVEWQATGQLRVRTYERGVEDETLACGTGVTACALANWIHQGHPSGAFRTAVQAQGGRLEVRFHAEEEGFREVWLIGAAELVFEGEILFSEQ